MRSFKSNENIHKKEGGSYYVVSANRFIFGHGMVILLYNAIITGKKVAKTYLVFLLSEEICSLPFFFYLSPAAAIKTQKIKPYETSTMLIHSVV